MSSALGKRKSGPDPAARGGGDVAQQVGGAESRAAAAELKPPAQQRDPMDISPSQQLKLVDAETIEKHANHWFEETMHKAKIRAVASKLFPDNLYNIEILDQLCDPHSTLAQMLKDHIAIEDYEVKTYLSHLKFEALRGHTDTKDLLDDFAIDDKIPPFEEAAPGEHNRQPNRQQPVRGSILRSCPLAEWCNPLYFSLTHTHTFTLHSLLTTNTAKRTRLFHNHGAFCGCCSRLWGLFFIMLAAVDKGSCAWAVRKSEMEREMACDACKTLVDLSRHSARQQSIDTKGVCTLLHGTEKEQEALQRRQNRLERRQVQARRPSRQVDRFVATPANDGTRIGGSAI